MLVVAAGDDLRVVLPEQGEARDLLAHDVGRLEFDIVEVGDRPSAADTNGDTSPIERYEKPTGQGERLVAEASRDPRAQILLGFARFPIARVEGGCPGQALVQFADLRYTEPGASRGNFSLTVPVECPAP